MVCCVHVCGVVRGLGAGLVGVSVALEQLRKRENRKGI